MENIQGQNNNQESVQEEKKRLDIRAENVEFLILEEKKLDGEALTQEQENRFEELKQIRANRDKKYAVDEGDIIMKGDPDARIIGRQG